MLFNSYIFIFLFLPPVWIAYWLLRGRTRSTGLAALVLASLFFYGYWDVRFLPLLLLSIATNFAIGRALHREGRPSRQRKMWLLVGIVFNLGLLGFFKYTNFFSEIAESLTGTPLISFHILLPIGISFFTFQQITYLVDIYRGEAERYSLLHYMLFISFFPQLIAGPIVHHAEMMPQFLKAPRPAWGAVALGLSTFIAGLFKKLVLADNIAPLASAVFSAADAGQPVSMVESWSALTAFSFQMYFDFSGYSDMALGLGLMFGIRLPINFHSPYKARTVAEFWRRWHMTLGRFLSDYIYLPLGGSRQGDFKTMRNLMVVMAASGIWHGAGWGFVIWGLLNGLWLWVNFLSLRFHALIGMPGRSLIPGVVAQVMMFTAVTFDWAFFRANTVDGMLSMSSAALGLQGLTIPAAFEAPFGPVADLLKQMGAVFSGPNHVGLGDWATLGAPFILLSFVIVWALPNTNQIFLAQDDGFDITPARRIVWRPTLAGFAAVSGTFVVALLFASSISEFLYFQF